MVKNSSSLFVQTKYLGTYHSAPHSQYSLVIVLIHSLGSYPKQLQNHVQFLNQHGFDVYTYSAFLHKKNHWKQFLPAIKKHKKSAIDIWSQELEQHLNQLSGVKILFGFSFLSMVALLVISKRKDIKALLCDSGPFGSMFLASWKFLTYYKTVSFFILKIYLSIRMALAFKILPIHKKQLLDIPKDFPVLSIQSQKDLQVSPSAINGFFKNLKQIKLTVVLLKNSAHLEGLKKQKLFYIQNITNFLKKISVKYKKSSLR